MQPRTSLTEIHEFVEVLLRRNDQRYTIGRRALVEALATNGAPMSIAAIEEALPKLPRSSAYRHLTELEKAGVVRRIAASDEFARFELTDDFLHHHHPLLCSSCGSVIDVTPSLDFEATVAVMVQELAERYGFDVTSHALDVIGHCEPCRTRSNEQRGR
jgi:Fur family ferric uptake transcriptional regulator